jgi:hypothetical protein
MVYGERLEAHRACRLGYFFKGTEFHTTNEAITIEHLIAQFSEQFVWDKLQRIICERFSGTTLTRYVRELSIFLFKINAPVEVIQLCDLTIKFLKDSKQSSFQPHGAHSE